MDDKKIAILISFFVGFSSLAIEILWIRVFSFALFGLPISFALVLTLYLLGIAFGARYGTLFVNRNIKKTIGWILLLSSFVDFSLLYIADIVLAKTYAFGMLILLFITFLTAYIKSMVFPLVHHMGSDGDKEEGMSVSIVYFANVMGSTLGPIVVTFVLLEFLETVDVFKLIAISSAVVSLFLLGGRYKYAVVGASVFVNMILSMNTLSFLSNVSLWRQKTPSSMFDSYVENRDGYITTIGDRVYGHGIYDGEFNIDIADDVNGITRIYNVFRFYDSPKSVLMIGLSSGSWANAVLKNSAVKELDIVEINAGYTKLIHNKNKNVEVLQDERVDLFFTDGRKYINDTDKKYDMIIMNTTYHYRKNASFLLSKEFLELAKGHLKNKRGLLFYNTTSSKEVINTSTQIFKYTFLHKNFAMLSDNDLLTMEKEKQVANLRNFSNLSQNDVARLAEESVRRISYSPDIEVVTDINPVNEYRKGYFK